jgi:hypothetical protein
MGPNTLPALITHSTDEMFKSSSHLTECILEPSSSRSFFGDQSPFSHAFETGMDFRTLLQLSYDQEVQLKQFMYGSFSSINPSIFSSTSHSPIHLFGLK